MRATAYTKKPMDHTERIYKIQQLLKARRAVPREVFLEELEVSPATFKRDLEYSGGEVHCDEGLANRIGPRAVRSHSRRCRRSVGRGTCRPAIEPR